MVEDNSSEIDPIQGKESNHVKKLNDPLYQTHVAAQTMCLVLELIFGNSVPKWLGQDEYVSHLHAAAHRHN